MIIYFAEQKAPSKNNYTHEIHKDIIISEIKSIDDIKSVIAVNKKTVDTDADYILQYGIFHIRFFFS